MADTGSKPILQIEVDDSQFDQFLAKYEQYRQGLDDMPKGWQKTDEAVKEVKTSFGGALSDFMKFDQIVGNPHITRTFSDFGKIAVASSRSWKEINQSIEKSAKGMSLLGRLGLQFSAGFGIAGLAGVGAAGAAYGAVAQASSDVSKDYKSSKNLGLELGKEKAFDTYFDTFGLGTGDLETAANNRGDMKKFSPYAVLGISQKQFTEDDPEKLAYESYRAATKKYSELQQSNPATATTIADAMGITKLFSLDQLRNGAHAGTDAIDESQQKYNDNWQKMGVSEKAAKDATDFNQHQQGNWNEIKTAWDKAVLTMAPAMNRWSDAATDMTTKFLNAAAPQVADVADAINDAHDGKTQPRAEGDKYPHTLLGGLTKGGYFLRDEWANLTGGIIDKTTRARESLEDTYNKHARHPLRDAPPPLTPGIAVPDPDRDAHQIDTDQLHGFRPGTTKAIEWQESHNHAGAQGPILKNGEWAKGAFQFMDGTAKAAGLSNPHDESKAMDVFGNEFDRLNHKFGDSSKAAAAYNWGEGNLAKDIAKWGDGWKDHLPKETKLYVQGYEEATAPKTLKEQVAALPQASKTDSDTSDGTKPIDASPARPVPISTHMAPVVFHVNVHAPVGSNTNVSTGANAQ